MAKKSPPPPFSSSEDESASSDDEQQPTNENPSQTLTNNKDESSDEESSDDEKKPESDTRNPNPSTSTSAPSKSSPESDSESDEPESDSDTEEAKLVKPISSKPMAEVETLVTKTIDAEKSNGKASGKPLFQRIWSLDDEIAILKAIAEFEAQHGPIKLNASAIGEFHAFVKGSLSLKVSDTQLVEKVRRLKKKYSGLDARSKKSKKELKFAKAHDQNVYELSKKVWGEGKDHDDDQHKVVRAKSVKQNYKGGSLKRTYPFLKDAVVKMKSSLVALEAIERIDNEKGSFLEKKVKKQKVMEIKHNIHEMELLKETVTMVMEGLERKKD